MKKQRRNVSEVISRMTILAMLSALGFVLMAFAQIPYPFAPWLKIEVSEIVTLIAYALYGLPGGLFVAFVKTALNLAVHGPVGLGIGDLTALFTSCMFVWDYSSLAMYLNGLRKAYSIEYLRMYLLQY